MKALKSKLVKQMLNSGIKIPRHNDTRFVFEGKEYIVKKVRKASL